MLLHYYKVLTELELEPLTDWLGFTVRITNLNISKR